MPDIVIHHCSLRITRRGGWSWGADPRRLVAGALHVLREMVCARLSELWPDNADLDLTMPLRIRIPLRMDALLAAGQEHADIAEVLDCRSQLDQAIEQAIKQLIAPAANDADEATEPKTSSMATGAGTANASADSRSVSCGHVLEVLLSWQAQGVLAARLTAFAPEALEAWHATVEMDISASPAPLLQFNETALLALARQVAMAALPLPAGRCKTLIQRLCIVAESVDRLSIPPSHPALRRVLDAVAPRSSSDIASSRSETVHGTDTAASTHALARDPPHDAHTRRALRRTVAWPDMVPPSSEVRVSCALPFILLGPLKHAGYLDAVAATMQAAGLTEELPSFATALARKVLDPPERGWFRRPETIVAAAAFAACDEPVPDPRLAELARTVVPHLSPLNALLAGALIDGHHPGQPLLLQKADLEGRPGYLLIDCEGMFPLARVERPPQLFSALASLEGSVLLVPQQSVENRLLAQLDEAGFVFVTDAPPLRDEPWQGLNTTRHGHWWSNRRHDELRGLSGTVERFFDVVEDGAALWTEVAVRRRACPVGSDTALEASLMLAVSFALGAIAWTLWRDREPVTPLLALLRFGDLEGRVTFEEDAVTVRLPLGRRYFDLYEHGLLADIRGVPWFAGRVLRFARG